MPGCGGFFIGIGVFSLMLSGSRSDRQHRRHCPQSGKQFASWPARSQARGLSAAYKCTRYTTVNRKTTRLVLPHDDELGQMRATIKVSG
jgi:hypothetical protein